MLWDVHMARQQKLHAKSEERKVLENTDTNTDTDTDTGSCSEEDSDQYTEIETENEEKLASREKWLKVYRKEVAYSSEEENEER